MFLHNINYSKFDISLGNTLTDPKHRTEKPFDIIVSNPPYSVKWVGNTDPTLINDERYSPAGVLAPNSKGDFAFVMHIINHLSSRGRAAVISFPGVFYRTQNAEKGIRRYLVDNNYIESIISLPDNLFFGTSIAVDVLILSKSKKDNKIQFIDASDFYKKSTNNNELTDENIDSIVKLFSDRKNVEYVSSMRTIEEIRENEYNLSVSSYVEKEDTKEKIDINKVNSEIELVVGRINKMRDDIDKIIKMI
jgi:type I restriction enzyme M protein